MSLHSTGVEAFRRLIDIVAATAGLVLLSPMLALIAMAVKLDSSGPVFYRARRAGQFGQTFQLYKFRTMINNADKVGPGITAAGDSRITRVGRWLRRTKLDELPQLINVIRGDMSLVGPRPEDPRYVALYTADQRQILQARPGITSAASLSFRNEEQQLLGSEWETYYCGTIMPAKIEIDLNYLNNRTLFTDFSLIVKTILAMAR